MRTRRWSSRACTAWPMRRSMRSVAAAPPRSAVTRVATSVSAGDPAKCDAVAAKGSRPAAKRQIDRGRRRGEGRRLDPFGRLHRGVVDGPAHRGVEAYAAQPLQQSGIAPGPVAGQHDATQRDRRRHRGPQDDGHGSQRAGTGTRGPRSRRRRRRRRLRPWRPRWRRAAGPGAIRPRRAPRCWPALALAVSTRRSAAAVPDATASHIIAVPRSGPSPVRAAGPAH